MQKKQLRFISERQPTTAQRCGLETEKKLLDLFSFVLSQFKKYHPSGNLKCNYLLIFKSLKRILIDKVLSISLKLNFTPNILGCNGLSCILLNTSKNIILAPQQRRFSLSFLLSFIFLKLVFKIN